jgi:hypothetical protein
MRIISDCCLGSRNRLFVLSHLFITLLLAANKKKAAGSFARGASIQTIAKSRADNVYPVTLVPLSAQPL